jgi:hypothetical protein
MRGRKHEPSHSIQPIWNGGRRRLWCSQCAKFTDEMKKAITGQGHNHPAATAAELPHQVHDASQGADPKGPLARGEVDPGQ